jgi:hypothetical protein
MAALSEELPGSVAEIVSAVHGLDLEGVIAFGAGVLLVSCIDAMSNFAQGPNRTARRRVGDDFCAFARTRLPSFDNEARAQLLYDDYRNGLVHEARLKRGCFLALDVGRTLDEQGTFPVIDVARLFDEVRRAVHQVADETEACATRVPFFRSPYSQSSAGRR